MSKRTLSVVLIVAGVAILVVSLGADALGLGNRVGFGWKQTVGAVVGVLVALYGAWYMRGEAGRK